jgi:hypothetical protein
MADEAIIDIKVNDERFRKFAEEFEKYAKRLEESHASWQKIAQATNEATEHLRAARSAMEGGGSRVRDADGGAGSGKASQQAKDIDRSFQRTHQNIRGIDQVFRGWERYAQRGGWLFALSDVFGLTGGGQNPVLRMLRDQGGFAQALFGRGGGLLGPIAGGVAAGRAVRAAEVEGGAAAAAGEAGLAAITLRLIKNPLVMAGVAAVAAGAEVVATAGRAAEDRRKARIAGFSPSQVAAFNAEMSPFYGPGGGQEAMSAMTRARFYGVGSERMTIDMLLGGHDIASQWLKANRPGDLQKLLMNRARDYLAQQPEEMRGHVAEDFNFAGVFGQEGVMRLLGGTVDAKAAAEMQKIAGRGPEADRLAQTGLAKKYDEATDVLSDVVVKLNEISTEITEGLVAAEGFVAEIGRLETMLDLAAHPSKLLGPGGTSKTSPPMIKPREGDQPFVFPTPPWMDPNTGRLKGTVPNEQIPDEWKKLFPELNQPSTGGAAATPGPTMAAMGYANDQTAAWMKQWFSQEAQYTRDLGRAAEARDSRITQLLEWLQKREDKSDKVDADLLDLINLLKAAQPQVDAAKAAAKVGGGGGGGLLDFLKTGGVAGASPAVQQFNQPGGTGGLTPGVNEMVKGGGFLHSLSGIESSNRNIQQQITDVNTADGDPASGYFQIIGATWRRYAEKAGVDLNQYPTPMSAPYDVQAKVAGQIPLGQFGPRTQQMMVQKFALDMSQTVGALAAQHGGMDFAAGGGPTVDKAAAASGPNNLGDIKGQGGADANALLAQVKAKNPSFSNDQCVTLVLEYCGMGGTVQSWRKGENVMAGNLKVGTPIATFMSASGQQSDRYDAFGIGTPGAGTSHAALFGGYTRDASGAITGMNVVEQYKGSGGAHVRHYGLGGFGEKNAANYFAIAGAGKGGGDPRGYDGVVNKMAGMTAPSPATASGGGGGWSPTSGGGQIASNMCGCGGAGPGASGGGAFGAIGSLLGGAFGGQRGAGIGGLLANAFSQTFSHLTGPLSVSHWQAPDRKGRVAISSSIGADVAVAGSLLGGAQGG